MAYYRSPPPPPGRGGGSDDVSTVLRSPDGRNVVRKDACDRGVCESSTPDNDGGGDDDDDDGDENDVGDDENEPVAGGGERRRSGGEGGGVETRTTGRRRAPGPNEAAYLRDHDASVSRAITLHEARTRTNLRSVDSSLPDYKRMGQNERGGAMEDVYRLLARLSCAGAGVGDAPEEGPDGTRGIEKTTPGGDDDGEDDDGEFRLHSTLGGPDDDATTLGDDQDASSRRSASLLHETRTTLGDYDDDDRDDCSRVHRSFSEKRRSTSLLLDESAILLSDGEDDDRGSTSGGEEEEEEEEEEERVERVRNSRRMLLSPLAAQTNELTPPPLLAHGGGGGRRASSKRCASNSGKRGSRARHRGGGGGRDDDDDDDDDDDGVDDSFLGRFGGGGGGDRAGGGTAFPHDRDDDAFFGVMGASPIQRRYSCDGLDDCPPHRYDDDDDDDDDEGEDGGVGEGSRSIDVLTPRRDREGDDDPVRKRSAVAAARHGTDDDDNIGAFDGDRRASDEDSRFSALDNDDGDVVFEGGKEDYYDEDHADRDCDDDYDGDGDGGIVGNRNEAERPASQWDGPYAFRTANAELTSTQLDRYGDDGDGDSPARQRAIRFDCASQKMMLKQSQRGSARQRGGDRRGTEEASLSELRVHDGDDEERSKEKENNADEDDPIQTVRNLCRRAKTTDELGMDSLEEVAPMDIRLRDGVNWKLDPLRCRQQDKDKISLNNKSKSSKKANKAFGTAKRKGNGDPKSVLRTAPTDIARGSRGGESSESDKSLSDPEPCFKDPISDFPSRVAARLNAGLSFLVEKEARAQTGAGTDECDYSSSAALLSMTARQILSVASKLLIQTRKSARLHQRAVTEPLLAKRLTPSSNAPPKDYDILAGGTLIVCRGKDDIEQWEVALREYTSLSVLSE